MNKLNKIVMIGPVYPYKGGISHYTGLMCKTLSTKYDVTMLSFKLQYPKILFRKPQKDFGNDTFRIDKAQFWLNTINPINWISIANRIKKINPDLIILQWWHPYFAPCYWVLLKFLKQYNILFLCHNVFPHERFPLDKILVKYVLRCGDFYIVQSEQDESDLNKVILNPRCIKTVHPTYNAFKMQNIPKEEARKLLDISGNEKILLFFGFVKEYKGLDCLLDALSIVKNEVPEIKLLIVGEFDNEKEKYMEQIKALRIQNLISIYDGYIPDKEVEKFFACCDLVVLPYKTATQSGIAQIAYGFEKPVVVTRVGGLPEIVKHRKTGYVVAANNSEELASAVIEYFINEEQIDFKENIRKESYKYDWERMTECVERLYEGKT